MKTRIGGPLVATAMVAGGLGLGGVMSTPAHAEMSGNIGVYSKYVLRGMTTPASESDEAVLQGGFDYAHDSGFYAGYWGSSLGYSDGGADDPATAFENDFYAGYAGEAGAVNYSLGLVYYNYMGIEDADAPEIVASVGYGPVTLGVNYLVDDVLWGNEGDMYWTVNYGTDLPADFSLDATLGYYIYEDEGEFIPAGVTDDDAFRHLNLTLAHPIGDSGADMSLTYVLGGDDRTGFGQEDTVVLGVSYGFDI